MVKRLSDLWRPEEDLPERWMLAIRNIQQSRDLVEAEKLRVQIELMIAQANVDLYVEDQAAKRAEVELRAAELRAATADRTAGRVLMATWVLAAATIGLVIATVILAVRG